MTAPFEEYLLGFGEKRSTAESGLEATALPVLERFAMKS